MAILDFQKPDKVVMLKDTETYGLFEFSPLEPGYAKTIGNSIRRVLLSSLEGHAIYAAQIDGVDHEFMTIKGVTEDVTDIILNLKKIRLKRTSEEVSEESVTIKVEGQTELTGEDINKALANFEVVNTDAVICHMDKATSLSMTLHLNKGRGYLPAKEIDVEDKPLGTIAIDAIYTPIKNVKYFEENFRVEQKTDYEKLVLELDTDGTVHPKEALKEASKILIFHYMLFSNEKMKLEESSSVGAVAEFDEEALHTRQLLKRKLANMELSVRALNCLKTAEVHTIGDLVQYQREDLLKFRNFGKKSFDELDAMLKKVNLTFGMDISKYKLDDNK